MKNLKRIFSLALAGTMLAGMLTIGASAATFTDAEDIQHVDAVNTLVALNVINGKPDGNYDPKGLVTRAEMAKMIATTVNGGVAPEFGTKPTPTYSDIKGNWAEQYIEYCYDMKYISGRGNGTFDPAGNVTGVEAAKMVLTALGYDETAYQLKGADWAINTNAIAIRTCKPSLYENLNGVNMNVAIDRDTAAQIIWNGVQNHIVEWTPNREVTGTGLNYQYTISDTVTLLNRAYDAYIWVGTFDGNDQFGGLSLAKGEIQVSGGLESANRPEGWTPTSAHFLATYDIANIGEETKVIFKDGKGGTKNQPDRNDTIYGVFNTGASNVLNVTSNDIAATDAADDGKVKVDGTVYNVVTPKVNDVLVVTNFGAAADVKASAADSDEVDVAFETLAKKNGDKVKFILDDTNKLAKAYVTHSELGKVTSKNSTKVNISGLGTIELAKNDVYEGIAKDDIVVFTKLYKSAAADAYTTVVKAEVVSGEVTGYKNSKDKSNNPVYETVTMEGATYKILNQAAMDQNFTDDAITNFGTGHIGEDFDLYLVNGYVAAAVKTSESASNYSLVTDIKTGATAGSVFDGLQVQLMAADGTKTIHTVSKSSEDVVTGSGEDGIKTNDYPKGTIVTYTIDGDGNAKLKAVGKLDDASSNGGYVKKTKSFDGAPTTASCVLFVSTSATGDYKAYNIRDLDDVTVADGTKNFAVVKDGDNVVAAYVDLKDTPDGATNTTVFGIVSAVNGTIKDGDTEYNTYTISVSGEDYTVNIEANGGTKDSLTKGSIYQFNPSSDNKYADSDKFTPVASVTGYKLGWTKSYVASDKLLTIWSAIKGVDKDGNDVADLTDESIVRFVGKTAEATMVLDDKADIYYVDTKADTSFEEGSVPSAFDPMTGYENVIVIGKTDDSGVFVISTLIVEVSGEKAIDD